MSENPHKRQRRSGSFSPVSPPGYHLAKTGDETKALSIHPALPTTPPSPTYMSSSQLHGNNTSIPVTHRPEFTPPSSVGRSPQLSQQPIITTTNTLSTPADSAAGAGPSAMKGNGEDTQMLDETSGNAVKDNGGDVEMSDAGESWRAAPGTEGHVLQEGSSVGQRDLDSGPLLRLGTKPYLRSKPHGSQNLISLYGLDSIASTVIRTDPVTGEKINKLRKSYEGHTKSLNIPGVNRPKAAERDLQNLLAIPEDAWHASKVLSKDLTLSQLDASIESKLSRAFKIGPGKLSRPLEIQYKSYVGSDDSKPKIPTDHGSRKPMHVHAVASPAVVQSPTSTMPAAKPRPARANAKRSYDETTYKGYGEGFADDMDSTDGGEDGGTGPKKRRRKGFGAGSPLGHERQNNYHVGMVGGVRR